MYIPKHFAETDVAVLQALIAAHPLGTWVTAGDGELIINHMPFYVDPHAGPCGTLIGHVARANPVWRGLADGGPSAVVFQGAHAHGQPRVVEDRARLLAIVTQLTTIHEADQARPWQVADAPPEFIDAMLAAIVGIEIPLTKLSGKWKVSQNRSAPDQRGTLNGLQASGRPDHAAMATEVARFIK
jgi:transcriptional regulator